MTCYQMLEVERSRQKFIAPGIHDGARRQLLPADGQQQSQKDDDEKHIVPWYETKLQAMGKQLVRHSQDVAEGHAAAECGLAA